MMTVEDAITEVREVALKFYRGHSLEYRTAYKEAGWLDRLEEAVRVLEAFSTCCKEVL